MKIIHLIPGLQTGGQETMLINIANEQVKEHEVIVMIVNADFNQDLIKLFDDRVRIEKIGRPRSSKNPWYFIKLNIRILQLHPYVVHSHYEKLVRYLIRLSYKFIYTIHGFTIPPKFLRSNTNLVAISKGIQKDVMDRANTKSIVIYNGLKVDMIKQRNELEEYNPNRTYRIVQVSRLFHEVKGQDVLLNAISILYKKGYTNLHLDFIGEGKSYDYLKSLVSELQLANVRFLGTKSVEYISENLCSYDLFVQASRHEGFGLTVAESMVAKIPVVISNCDGLMEVVDNGKYSLVFDNGSAEGCAEKIEEILNSPVEELQKRVDSARIFVEKNFNVKVTAANYINYYKECE